MKTRGDKLLPQLPSSPDIPAAQQEFNRSLLRVVEEMNKNAEEDLDSLQSQIDSNDTELADHESRITALEP